MTNSILLTGSFTHNIKSRLTNILYVTCIIYGILTIKLEKRGCYWENTFPILYYIQKFAYKWIFAVQIHVVQGSAECIYLCVSVFLFISLRSFLKVEIVSYTSLLLQHILKCWINIVDDLDLDSIFAYEINMNYVRWC